MANSVTSKEAREIFAQAHGSTGVVPKVVQMAFGNGGVDGSNVPIPPSATAKPLSLGNQLLVKAIESVSYPVSTTVRFTCRLLSTELNGYDISEAALVDSVGHVVAKKTFTKKGKDNETELVFEWDEEF